MKVIVFEDDTNKWLKIKSVLLSKGIRESNIRNIDNTAQYVEVSQINYDLCVIDVRMPGVVGGDTRDAGLEILQMIDFSGRRKIPVLAITSYMAEVEDKVSKYKARGCIIYDYNDQESWTSALDIYIAQAQNRGRYDFLIFTALHNERIPYLGLITSECTQTIRDGLNVLEFEYCGKQGGVVLCPRMGLVNATAVVAKALATFTPSFIAMSGICAGIGSNTKLGQLLITDIVWEYQSGKWFDEVFESEPYQVGVDESVRNQLVAFAAEPDLLQRLERRFSGSVRPSSVASPKLAAFTTGSAVIASKKRLKHVKAQHRKVEGLDMEIYGFHRAAQLSSMNIAAISAKTVVDVADKSKSDDIHSYGCWISAAFILEFMKSYFGNLRE